MTGQSFSDELFVLNDFLLRHPASRRLAKQVVYTSGKSPADLCAEIGQMVRRGDVELGVEAANDVS